MYNLSESPLFSITKQLFLVSIFVVFSIPFSLGYGGGSSANYSYIFFPILVILLNGKVKIPNRNIIMIILIFFIIFFIASLYQYDFYKYMYRRELSFIIFMSIFSYLFINITEEMVKAFKVAIVVFSCAFSLLKIGDYYLLNPEYGGDHPDFSAKTVIGSQRHGFMYVFAFWILFFYESKLKSMKILKLACILIIILGLLNTFSRTAILTLLISAVIFFYTTLSFKIRYLDLNSFLRFLKYCFIFIVCCFFIIKYLPEHFNFYLDRIYYYFLEGGFHKEIIASDSRDSLGFRMNYLKKILNFVNHNPFTGSGFLGCWVMYESLSCSAHNQYADVLFRTGYLGIFIYFYLLCRIFYYLKITNRDLFFGFIALLIYSIFHETFKLSHGAFLLTFLIGMSHNKKPNFHFLK